MSECIQRVCVLKKMSEETMFQNTKHTLDKMSDRRCLHAKTTSSEVNERLKKCLTSNHQRYSKLLDQIVRYIQITIHIILHEKPIITICYHLINRTTKFQRGKGTNNKQLKKTYLSIKLHYIKRRHKLQQISIC